MFWNILIALFDEKAPETGISRQTVIFNTSVFTKTYLKNTFSIEFRLCASGGVGLKVRDGHWTH